MPITDDLRKTLTDPTPLYALAGAGDLAYEKLREVPGIVEEITADRKAAQERAAARLQEAQTRLSEAQARVTETVSTLPNDLKVLQERAQGFALQQVGRAAELAVKAKEVYDELAERGKVVVDRSRREAAAQIEDKGADLLVDTAVAVAPDEPAPAVGPEATVTTTEIVTDEPTSDEATASAKPSAKRTGNRKATPLKP
jgi:phosphoglycolate phosphatase-like HAD superfamily hydrolase